jgi:microcystin-dependent protein
MAQPYIGEIRMFAGNFAPAGWEFCAGQLMAIAENETLFQLIGTTYGGDGQSTFALPDLRGRAPMHQGAGFVLAETGGSETVTLTLNQTPQHSHQVNGSASGAAVTSGAGNVPGTMAGVTTFAYGTDQPTTTLAPGIIVPSPGGSQPHENMQPYLCLSFIISLFGIFPSPT